MDYLCPVDLTVSWSLSPNKQEIGLGDSEDKTEKWHILKQYTCSYNGATTGFKLRQSSPVCLRHIAHSKFLRIKYASYATLVFEVSAQHQG